MPESTRTGPYSEGPKTRKGLEFCSGQEQPGFQNSNENVAFGYGQGWRNEIAKAHIYKYYPLKHHAL